ncbi:FadR/GntR family transcriptional regulator [Siculibacillus lacustris]|uniref:FadR/GntR family transcriptional regulator n=1 Tax=Siculibacillus lacustris TaxID=1549641 RepID=UPI0013F17C9B|nr:FadR/GntR family transcriptional regulator [Siculibacillus lacustris]
MLEPIKTPSEDSAPARREGGESRADQVVAYLRDHIAAHRLRPGSRLPSESVIGASLGISRPIVREAMRTLAATGLIEMAVGKRATVSPLDGATLRNVIENAVLIGQADVGHVMEMRRGIEIAMVAVAAERCTPETAAALEAIVAEMAGKLDDVVAYTTLDMRLHLTLAEAADNPLYLMLVEAFRQIFQTSMMIGIERWAETPELNRVQQLHEEIVAAVVAGDPAAASTAMAQHFDNAIRVMFATTAQAPGGDGPTSGA